MIFSSIPETNRSMDTGTGITAADVVTVIALNLIIVNKTRQVLEKNRA